MGKNKLKKFKEFSALENVIELPYSVLKELPFELKSKWKHDFFKNGNPLVLELGCGKGEYAVGLARENSSKNYIGLDIKGARMWSGAKESFESGLNNVAFIRTSIEFVNSFFGEEEVDEIWITFPDPQMQKYTKRLTSTPFISRYKKLLNPQGIIHLKTDSPFLYQYTLEMIKENEMTILDQCDDLYARENPEVLHIQTYYEKQWIARGMTIKYLQFMLDNKQELKEPDVEIEPDTYRSFNRGEAQKL